MKCPPEFEGAIDHDEQIQIMLACIMGKLNVTPQEYFSAIRDFIILRDRHKEGSR